MFKKFLLIWLFLAVLGCAQHTTAESSDGPFGIAKRVPWTSSRITGSPDPPLPFTTSRIYPRQQFEQPVEMVTLPGSTRPCVVERRGDIFLLSADPASERRDLIFAGSRSIRGLTAVYGLAFHPNFETNRTCFVCYILKPELDDGTRVSRFRMSADDPPKILPETEEILLTWRSGGHNGGSLKFGPDGMLYISTGDASPPSPPDVHDTGQNVDDLLSCILRIDVDAEQNGNSYAIPADNPFVDTPGARGEIWAYGFRNPWRMSLDRGTGALWLGDVGWQLWEMVFRVERGGNYGWSVKEGPQFVRPEATPGPTPILPPVISHPRSEAASVTGGFVYRGSRLKTLIGHYVYGDYVTGKIWSLRFENGEVTEQQVLADTTHAIIAFYEAPDGELAYMDYNGGGIYRLEPNEIDATGQVSFPRKLSETGLFASVAEHRPAAGVVPFSINAEQWADHATAERFVGVPGEGTITLVKPAQRVPNRWGSFPRDTVLVKTISLEMETGNPDSRRRIETQILHFSDKSWRGNSGEWFGYTYVWNEEQTDAKLAPAEGLNLQFSIADSRAAEGKRQQTYRVSSRSECYLCHNPWTGYRLAFTPPNLDKRHVYGEVTDHQLRTLSHIGLLKLETPTEAAGPWPRFVDPHDQSAPLEDRAKSYLHVNCAHCHRFGGGGTATIDLRFEASRAEMNAIDVRPTQGTFNMYRAKVIAPGDPFGSVLLYRMAKLGRGRMPYVGSQIVDHRGLDLIQRWIREMPPTDDSLTSKKRQQASTLLDELFAHDQPSELRMQHLLDSLLTSTSAALMTARRLDLQGEDGVKNEVKAAVISHAAASHHLPVRDLFERFLPSEQRSGRLGSHVNVTEILAMPADAGRGRKLFLETAGIQCKNCHRLGQTGENIGPDLAAVARLRTKPQLLESIVAPSRSIDPKFVSYLIETVDGRVLVGLLAERTDKAVVVVDAKGQRHKITSGDIEQMVPQHKSLMPDLLYQDMTAQQLADLLAFLKSL